MNNATAILFALDTIGVALSTEGHIWTARERRLYDEAVTMLLPDVIERKHILLDRCWCGYTVEHDEAMA